MAWIYGYPSKKGEHLGPESLPNSPPGWWGLGLGLGALGLEPGAWGASGAWGMGLGLGAWSLKPAAWEPGPAAVPGA